MGDDEKATEAAAGELICHNLSCGDVRGSSCIVLRLKLPSKSVGGRRVIAIIEHCKQDNDDVDCPCAFRVYPVRVHIAVRLYFA